MTVTGLDHRDLSFPRNNFNLELNIKTLSSSWNSLRSTCLSCHFFFAPYRSWHSSKSHSVVPQIHSAKEIFLSLFYLD